MALTLAVTTSEVLETGGKVGTASNQVILGCLVVALIAAVLYRERQQNHAIKAMESTSQRLVERIDRDRTAWDDERRARITFLMELVGKTSTALERCAASELAMREAMEQNTLAMHRLCGLLDKRA